MKVIKVSVNAARDGEVVSGVFMKQRRKGSAWTNEESITVVSGQPGSERTFVLDNDQRLVIEGQSDQQIVMDRAQMAAVPQRVIIPPRPPTPPSNDGEETSTPSTPGSRDMSVQELTAAQQQERRDAAITAARLALKSKAS